MAMRALRDGASKGILKFFLLGILVLAGGGLVFTDVGGFFRGGGLSRSDVIKVGSETISIYDFDSKLSGLLRNVGMNRSEAYQRGYVNELIRQEISNSIILQSANQIGLKIGNKRAAQKVKEVIAADIAMGATPEQALQQRLRLQGMNEKQFVAAIKSQMVAEPFLNAIQTNPTLSNFVLEDILQYQEERRNINLVILKDSDFKIETPKDEDLLTTYQMTKEEHAIPETRKFKLIEIIYTPESKDITEDEILEETYALSDIVDDLAASGANSAQIAEETGAKIIETEAISANTDNLDQKIIEAGFDLEEEGEISPTFETSDDKFMAIELISITPKSYKNFESVKGKVKKRWIEAEKRNQNKIKTISIANEINNDGKKLSSIGAIKTLTNVPRSGDAPKPLTPQSLSAIFQTKQGEAITVKIDGGLAIAIVTKVDSSKTPSKETKQKIHENLTQASGNEALMLYLENQRKDMTIKTNERLLENTYAAQPDDQ